MLGRKGGEQNPARKALFMYLHFFLQLRHFSVSMGTIDEAQEAVTVIHGSSHVFIYTLIA